MAARKHTSGRRQRNAMQTEGSLLSVMSHPLRVELLMYLNAGEGVTLSPRELSDLTGEKLATVAYHVRRLLDAGAVRLVKKQQRRGAIEHHYATTPGASRVLAAAYAAGAES